MFHKLTSEVWFGDKPSVTETLGRVRSVINVAHSIRQPYWTDLIRLPYDVFYFRLAKKDREHFDDTHFAALTKVLDAILIAGKIPLLCHCRLGGHRGPSTALFAAWHFAGRHQTDLDFLHSRMVGLVPGLINGLKAKGGRCLYYKLSMAYCNANSIKE